MGKYDPLASHLRRQKLATYEMSFRDIERVLGGLLPKRAHRPEWWSNDESPDSRRVQCRAWLDAGFGAHAQPGIERIQFVRRPAPSR